MTPQNFGKFLPDYTVSHPIHSDRSSLPVPSKRIIIRLWNSAHRQSHFTEGINKLPSLLYTFRRSQWPRCLRRTSAAVRLPRSWVRIPPGAWMFVCCECCMLSGRGLWEELITSPEESYRLWCVVVCDLETSRMRPWPALGRSATKKTIHIYYPILVKFDTRDVNAITVVSFMKTDAGKAVRSLRT